MLAVEPIADSTPGPALELPESVSTDKFTREEREAWMKDGTVPGVKAPVLGIKTPDADADPKKAASEPAGDAVASPAEDKSAQGKKDADSKAESGKAESKKDTEARFQELLKDRKEARDENKKLLARLEALEKGEKPAPPAEVKPPVEAKAAKDPKDERPRRLSMEEFIAANPSKDWKDYEDYKDDYHEKLSDWKVRAAVREALADQESKQAEKSITSARDATVRERVGRALKDKDMPDFVKVVSSPEITAAIRKSIGGVMGAFFDERDVDCKVQYFLGSNLEEADRIAGLTPIGQARALNKLEDKFYPEDDGEAKPVSDEVKPAPVQEKKLSAASTPPSRVSGNSSVIEDEAKAALAAGDFARFAEIENRRDIERAKVKGR